MKYNSIVYSITLLTMIASSIVKAEQTVTTEPLLKNLSSNDLLYCKTDFVVDEPLIKTRRPQIKTDQFSPVSLVYMNDEVKKTYDRMRKGVANHVTMKVAMSFFKFGINGLAPENIANYVSSGTQAFLPFEFANGVKITKVISQGRTVIYRTEMPIAKNNSYVAPLALAGRVSTIASICNDKKMVDDLLERHLVIQYDYYDANGVFISSFKINDNQEVNQLSKKQDVPLTMM